MNKAINNVRGLIARTLASMHLSFHRWNSREFKRKVGVAAIFRRGGVEGNYQGIAMIAHSPVS